MKIQDTKCKDNTLFVGLSNLAHLQRVCSISNTFDSFIHSFITAMSSISKDTLFVWDGILEVGDDTNGSFDCVWYGTVTASENAPDPTKVEAPVRNAFKALCDSDLQFRVTGKAQPSDGIGDSKSYRLELTGGDGWDYAGSKHMDTVHNVLTALQWQGNPDKRLSLCFGCGSDAHGNFISTGWMRPGNRITLARRYVVDTRKELDCESLRDQVLQQIYDEDADEIILPPWMCDLFRA